MAIRSTKQYQAFRTRAGSIGSQSSYATSLVRKTQAAEDDYWDDQYKNGVISAETYLTKLEERRQMRTYYTPLQKQNLDQKIRDVGVDYQDSQVQLAYKTGGTIDGKTVDLPYLIDWEKKKLEKMTPDSQAYNSQATKVQNLTDQQTKAERTAFRVSENLRISKLPEDSSTNLWQKARLYEKLAADARVDGDNQQADVFETSKNNYTQAAQRADINDQLTGARLATSETPTEGLGVPSAEGGQQILNEMTGTATPGTTGETPAGGGTTGGGTASAGGGNAGINPASITNNAVKNALEGLDSKGKQLKRLYAQRQDKQTLIDKYKNAIAGASGDQKTSLTIALNNLVDGMKVLDNSIANTENDFNEQVTRVQEARQKAVLTAFNQEVRNTNFDFTKVENSLERDFSKGKIGKEEYIAKAVGLAAAKLDFFNQTSSYYNNFDEADKADAFIEKANEFSPVHERLQEVLDNISNYEPIVVDPSGRLTNISGKQAKPGDVVLTNVQQAKDNGTFDSNYMQKGGVFYRVHYPGETSDSSGMPISSVTSADLARFRGTSYVYEGNKKTNVDFVKYTDENNKPVVKVVPQIGKGGTQELLKTGYYKQDPKTGALERNYYTPEKPNIITKAAAGLQQALKIPSGGIGALFNTAKQAIGNFLAPPVSGAERKATTKVATPIKTTGATGGVGSIIDKIANEFAPGDEEFRKVLNAIALAESGGNPAAVGDNGASIGLFQNNTVAGRGVGHTKQALLDPEYNTRLAAKELINYYKQGVSRGLKGSDLTAYVSRYGQRPAAGLEKNAAANYGRYVGVSNSAGTNEPGISGQDIYVQQPSGGFIKPIYAAEKTPVSQPSAQVSKPQSSVPPSNQLVSQAISQVKVTPQAQAAVQKIQQQPVMRSLEPGPVSQPSASLKMPAPTPAKSAPAKPNIIQQATNAVKNTVSNVAKSVSSWFGNIFKRK